MMSMLDADSCYRAYAARDARFDGRFFTGVTSTGVYCRPVCTARLPKPENCRFFPSAAAAEAAGFRPCLVCRPECAPGESPAEAGQRLADAAAGLIAAGGLDEAGLGALCGRLGVSARHLRRVFRERFGVTPVAYAQTRRLLLAKALLADSGLSATDVAFASGFSSLRRFNALFQSRYGLSPSQLRRAGEARAISGEAATVELGYRPPYDWNGLMGFLGVRAVAGVEEAGEGAYRRTLRLWRNGTPHAGWLAVCPAAGKNALRVAVSTELLPVLPAVLARVSHLFDVRCDPWAVSGGLSGLADGHEGVRLPGTADGFETAVRAILGQQVTVVGARTLAGRFAAAFGDPVATPFAGLSRLFPDPGRVAALSVEAIAALGVIAGRARAILALAGAVRDGDLELSPTADLEKSLDTLRALPGVGEWTAQYIAMRALGWPDAFPHTDGGLKKALGETDPKRIARLAEAWRPWRAYAVMHLWRTLQGAST
ncbi:MAG: DNA-3-methyladenine glycosylase 2 [Solidesulfovibrio sp.]|uniref:DNA-3-methyladenine glycosylase 2 n=1 Tax=Solidesulfovibrio sp. TaxID=2910990 RepID=UPI0031580958